MNKALLLALMLVFSASLIPVYSIKLNNQMIQENIFQKLQEMKNPTRYIPGIPRVTEITTYYTTAITPLTLTYLPLPVFGIPIPDVSIPDPYNGDNWIYMESKKARDAFDNYLSYPVHFIDREQATFSKFINELRGYDEITESYIGIIINHKRVKYLHFAGHGGKTSDGTPFLLTRDDSNPTQYRKLYPYSIYDSVDKYWLKDITKLIYLSACYSLVNKQMSSPYKSFAYVLTNPNNGLGVNYIIGYSGEVNTILATVFAEKFYELHLKNGETIIDAFMNAKSEIGNDLGLIVSIAVSILMGFLTGGIGAIWAQILISALSGAIGALITIAIVNTFLSNLQIMSSNDW